MNIHGLSNQQVMLENFKNIHVPNFDKIYSIGDTLSNFSDLFSNIDSEAFEITEDDIKEVNDILESEYPEEEVTKEINQNKEIPDSIKTMVLYIFRTIEILFYLVVITEFTEERMTQVDAYYDEYIAADTSKSDREAINCNVLSSYKSRNCFLEMN